MRILASFGIPGPDQKQVFIDPPAEMFSIKPPAGRDDGMAWWKSAASRWWTWRLARMIRGSGDLPRPQNASLSHIAGKSASSSSAILLNRCWFSRFLPDKRDKGNRSSGLIIPSHRYWFSSTRSLYESSTSEIARVQGLFEFSGKGHFGTYDSAWKDRASFLRVMFVWNYILC